MSKFKVGDKVLIVHYPISRCGNYHDKACTRGTGKIGVIKKVFSHDDDYSVHDYLVEFDSGRYYYCAPQLMPLTPMAKAIYGS